MQTKIKDEQSPKQEKSSTKSDVAEEEQSTLEDNGRRYRGDFPLYCIDKSKEDLFAVGMV